MSFARRYRNELGLLLAIVLVLGAAYTSSPAWQTADSAAYNAKILVRSASVLGIFALGAGVVIISGGIDLSAGSVIAFSATACGGTLLFLADKTASGQPDMIHLRPGMVAVAVLVTLAAGAMIGTFHAWLITAIRLPPFVATLASLVGLRSLARILIPDLMAAASGGTMNAAKITVQDAGQYLRGAYDIDRWYVAPLILLALAFLTWVLLAKTVAGRHLYAMGGNEEAARLSGIRTDRLKWLAYCVSSVTASVAGVLLLAETGSADPSTQGLGYELYAIAASVIGGCALTGGAGTVLGILLGALFLRVVIESVAKVVPRGVSPDELEGLIVGLLVLLAVAFNELRSGSGLRRPFFAGWLGVANIAIVAALTGVVTAVLVADEKAKYGLTAAGVMLVLLTAKKAFEVRAARQG